MRLAIKMIEGLHLTTADRRDIAHLLSWNARTGHTNRKNYVLEPAETANRWRVTITKHERDDWGRRVSRTHRYLIETSARLN